MSLGEHLDTSLPSGEEIRFKQKNSKLLAYLAKTTHMTFHEIELLSIIYYKLLKLDDNRFKQVRRVHIKDVLHNAMDITNNEMMPYILSFHDKSLTPYMSLKKWIEMMSLYLRGTFDEKIYYCYTVYKSTGVSNLLLRNQIVNLLKTSLRKDNNEFDVEAIKDMVDMIIKRMDVDRDGKISYSDFRNTVIQTPDFLEAFGDILPSRLAVYAFRHTFIEKFRKK